ncbi:hypothetical protein [Rhabdochromatium marinum]|uniref:hypothetical protein n=1 Tax=Rhabdochromatium marinum TaxID=48729 RepID=UPI0019033A09|nr:hypothetical protein [Rhabdochromatium marinum]MBK1648358.1 hypothetical protein [Rhabdochromatium marinum]
METTLLPASDSVPAQKPGSDALTAVHLSALFLLLTLCSAQLCAMGDAPDPEAASKICLKGEAVKLSGTVSECRWANAQTGWNSVTLTINPDEPYDTRESGEILDAYFSTGVTYCDVAAEDEACESRSSAMIGHIIARSDSFEFRAGDAVLEGQVESYRINGKTYYGFAACVCP